MTKNLFVLLFILSAMTYRIESLPNSRIIRQINSCPQCGYFPYPGHPDYKPPQTQNAEIPCLEPWRQMALRPGQKFCDSKPAAQIPCLQPWRAEALKPGQKFCET